MLTWWHRWQVLGRDQNQNQPNHLYLCTVPIFFPPKMMMQLPPDVLRHLSDFLECAALSHTCQKAWGILQRRHLRCILDADILQERGADLSADAAHTLRAIGKDLDGCAEGLNALGLSDTLRVISVNLRTCNIGDKGAQALAALRNIWFLHTLELDLSSNSIGFAGAQALGALWETRALHTLRLDLGYNAVGDEGASELAALRHSPVLRSLTLNLGYNGVGDRGVEALVPLKTTLKLRTLLLNLESNTVGARCSLRHAHVLCSELSWKSAPIFIEK